MKICASPGCNKPTSRSSKDFCNTHYRKALAEGRRVIVPITDEQKTVIIAAYESGLSTYKIDIVMHMREDKIQWWLRKWGVVLRPVGFQTGHKSPRFKGRKLQNGYVLVYMPDHPHADRHGYVREHRLVAEKTLKRQLQKDEIAHHENETKDDNDPHNIVVMSNSEHTALHNPRLGTGLGIIECPECNRYGPHCARGLCRRCYSRLQARKRRALAAVHQSPDVD